MNNFSWDGMDSNGNQTPSGKYNVSLVGKNAAGGTDQSAAAYVASMVVTVSKAASGTDINLLLADGRTVAASSVTQWDS